MNRIVLVGCGKAKRADGWRGPIVDLYTGPLYTARLAAARAMGGAFFILSALHGIKRPDVTVRPYDLAMSDLSGASRRAWGDLVAWNLIDFDRTVVVALASADYIDPWRARAERAGIRIETPLAGLGIGDQRKRCAEIVTEALS